MRHSVAIAATVATLASYTAAAVTPPPFLIPGVEVDGVSASELGVGPGGVTTWAIVPLSTATGPWLYADATIVAGPSTADLVYVDKGLGELHESCKITDGDVFDCVISRQFGAGGITTTGFTTTTVPAYLAQQTSASTTPSGSASSSSSTPTAPPSPSGSSPTGSQTSTSPAPTNTNGAGRTHAVQAGGLLAVALAAFAML